MSFDLERHLEALTDEKFQVIHRRLQTKIVRYVKGNFHYGAHSQHELGEDYLSHYSMRAWEKLMSGTWTWKPDKTILEQLEIIAKNLIGKQVEKYERKTLRLNEGRGMRTKCHDPLELNNLSLNDDLHDDDTTEFTTEFIEQAIHDDEDLVDLFRRLMRGETYKVIRESNGWPAIKLYRLIDKFKRRVEASKKKFHSNKNRSTPQKKPENEHSKRVRN